MRFDELVVQVVDTFDTENALNHLQLYLQPKRRIVRLKLTDEQIAALELRQTGLRWNAQLGQTLPEYEHVEAIWLERTLLDATRTTETPGDAAKE